MLDYELVDQSAGDAGAPCIVLLHGRGADAPDLMPLAERLPPAVFAFPRAPYPGAPWGYGAGWAWYRYLGEDRPEPETLEHSLAELDGLLDTLADQVGAGAARPLVLGGFSQGGTMSLAHALTRPRVVGRVLNFSGFLASHPDVDPTRADGGLRVFWAHGKQDPAIPFGLAEKGRARLREAGVEVVAKDYEIGHWIEAGELRDAVEFLERV